MPSLPTSLILVGLVVAWLVVLVPMVARRRERVPENHEDGASFRVLHRDSARGRRRPVFSRTAMARDGDDEVPGYSLADADADEAAADGDALVGGFGDRSGDGFGDGAGEGAGAGDGDDDRVVAGRRGAEGRGVGRQRADVDAQRSGRDRRAPRTDDADRARMAARATAGVGSEVAVRGSGGVTSGAIRDAADDWQMEHATRDEAVRPAAQAMWRTDPRARRELDVRDDEAADSGSLRRGRSERSWDDGNGHDAGDGERADRALGDDGAAYRSTPVRPGRGGFDPRAAERARALRFRQRRRVALVLAALMVVGVPVGIFGVSYGWVGTAIAGVLLVLYLAYLRRQVRIEEAIRRRRASRLERAQQIRPAYRPSVAEQVYAHRTGGVPSQAEREPLDYGVKSHARPTVPPSVYRRGVPVDFEDSDPAFDDLEYYRPAASRRRAG